MLWKQSILATIAQAKEKVIALIFPKIIFHFHKH